MRERILIDKCALQQLESIGLDGQDSVTAGYKANRYEQFQN